MPKKSIFTWLDRPAFYIGMVVLGTVVGGAIPTATDWFNPLLKIYISVLNLFVFPLIILSVIFGLAQFSALPRAPQRLGEAIGLGLCGLVISGLIAALISVLFSPGAGVSQDLRTLLGELLQFDAARIALHAAPVAGGDEVWAPVHFMPSNIFYALAYQPFIYAMVGSLVFGFGFTLLPSSSINSLFEHLEVVYIALENLISMINKSLPFVAGIFAVNIFSILGKGGLELITSFFIPFFIAITLVGLLNLLIVAYVADATFKTVASSLARAVVISFLARSPAAGVPEVISCLSDRFGFKRSLVRFFAPLFPLFFNVGEVIFLTLAAAFAMNFYDQPLTLMVLAQVFLMSVICAFVSSVLTGGGSLLMATFLLQAFSLPLEALLPGLLILEIFLAGAKSAISLLFACAIISLVSHGLNREASALMDGSDNSQEPIALSLDVSKRTLVLLYFLLASFLATVFAIGLGVGARNAHLAERVSSFNEKAAPEFCAQPISVARFI